MSKRQILIQVEPPELRVAEVRDGRLFDFEVERAGRVLGDIYKGRVENVLPGMDGAFVDIGLRRNALIYVGDVVPDSPSFAGKKQTISQLLRTNDEIVVQVARPPVGGKGARVTTKLSLPGRFLILLTQTDNVGVSKKIEDAKERQRLRQIVEKFRPLDHGIILRTEAEGASAEDLERDIKILAHQMQQIKSRVAEASAPALLHRESGLLERVVRDKISGDVESIMVDSKETFGLLKNMLHLLDPQMENRVQLYDDAAPIFEKFGVSSDIKQAQERIIALPRGASISVDETEALIAIDVNTGSFIGKKQLAETVLQTNLEAVEEIARQLRLRNLGGVIVIDFIDMPRTRDRIKVLNALEAALKYDKTRTHIVNISPSGLVEMTRRREGYSLRQLLHENCPYCDGDGVVQRASTVAIQARTRLRELSAHQPEQNFEITLHPEAACAFLGPSDEMIEALEEATETEIFVRADASLHIEATQIVALSRSQSTQDAALEPVNRRVYLSSPSTLYPQRQPRFIVVENRLARLENLGEGGYTAPKAGKNAQLPPTMIEISDEHRWCIKVKIVAQGAPEPQ